MKTEIFNVPTPLSSPRFTNSDSFTRRQLSRTFGGVCCSVHGFGDEQTDGKSWHAHCLISQLWEKEVLDNALPSARLDHIFYQTFDARLEWIDMCGSLTAADGILYHTGLNI